MPRFGPSDSGTRSSSDHPSDSDGVGSCCGVCILMRVIGIARLAHQLVADVWMLQQSHCHASESAVEWTSPGRPGVGLGLQLS